MSAAGDSGQVSVGTAGRIMVGITQCGTATTAHTDTIVVTGNTGAETLTLDLSGGSFAPGLAVEGSGLSEIEFTVDLGTGTGDRITVTGGAGNENLSFGSPGANLNGDNDVDMTLTGVELGTVNASGGDDTFTGAGDAVTGSPSSILFTLNGESGDDSLTGGSGDDTITGGTGTNALAGGAGDDTVTGGQGNDTLSGGPGGDTLVGGLGNDTFDEGASASGSDSIAGSGGIDTVTYGSRANGVTVTLDAVFDDGETGEGDSVAADVENATGGAGDNVLLGSALANTLTGQGGADTIDGAAGDDSISGGPGADRLTGGAGNDTVSGGSEVDAVVEGAGNDTVDGGGDGDTLDYSAVTGALTISLALATPQITGGAGTDTITGLRT